MIKEAEHAGLRLERRIRDRNEDFEREWMAPGGRDPSFSGR